MELGLTEGQTGTRYRVHRRHRLTRYRQGTRGPSEGAQVTLNGRTAERRDTQTAVEHASPRSPPSASVTGLAADLGGAAGCAAVIRQRPELDMLVNNLGIFEPKPFEQIPDADWFRFFETNVLSGVRLTRHYLPGMRRSEVGPGGLRFQRVGRADSGGDDPLRHDQDGATGHRSWSCRDAGRHRCDGQQCAARTHRFGGGGKVRQGSWRPRAEWTSRR